MIEWISVEKELPPSDVDSDSSRYLVFGKVVCGGCNERMHVFECRWKAEEREWEWGEYDCEVEAKYWIPLPKPPEINDPINNQ